MSHPNSPKLALRWQQIYTLANIHIEMVKKGHITFTLNLFLNMYMLHCEEETMQSLN